MASARRRDFTNDYLASIWRSREAQLLRTLNAKNLDMIKESFDAAEEMGQEGLTAADFVRMMLKIFGHFTFDKDELCIQILELFANIDVRSGGACRQWQQQWAQRLPTRATSFC